VSEPAAVSGSDKNDDNSGSNDLLDPSRNSAGTTPAAIGSAIVTPRKSDEHTLRDQPEARAVSRPAPKEPLPAADSGGASDDARAELAFMTRVQKTLQKAEPEQVLALAQEHARRWPHGTFVEEREGLRTIATCQTRAAQAVSVAREFTAAYPRSPMLANVVAACARSNAAAH
jgi:hypothetical protein